jgi:RNA polymerase sigma-70 factor (ECF subfamily)
VSRLRAGDRRAFEELVRTQQHRVYGRRLTRDGEKTLSRIADARPGPDQAVEQGELEEALHRAIGELPEERRIVVVLRDVEGLAYEEIAEVLDLPVGTVRSRLHRARLDLKEKLERFFP